jgi:putative SOS response-associated peptidase YedK
MCGRVIQSSRPDVLSLRIVDGLEDRDNRIRGDNSPPRYNGAPSQELWVIRRNHETGERTLDKLRWGLIPSWMTEKPKPPPINARCETVAKLPMFRRAYASRRAIIPIDGFYEWKAMRGAKAKQPYALAMKDRSPFGVAGLWENWKDPSTGEWLRTFCVVTTNANDLVRRIHDRMTVILAPKDYDRWLGAEPDPSDLMAPFPAEPMAMWPVSTRVNSPRNDDPQLLDAVEDAAPTMPPNGNSA